MRAVIALFLTVAACGRTPGDRAAASTDDAGRNVAERAAGWAACASALAGPADGLDRGLGRLLAGCVPCGVGWEPLLALSAADPDEPAAGLPGPEAVLAVLDACGTSCSGSARHEVAHLLREAQDGRAASAPWKRLAERCPEALHVDDHTRRFARGTWYALDRVARALWSAEAPPVVVAARDAAALEFPLPPLSQASTALAVPTVATVAPWAPRLHVTITEDKVHVGVLPWVTLAGGAPALVPGPGLDYPGEAVAPGRLAEAVAAASAALAASRRPADAERRLVVIAPRGMRAARLLEVARELTTPFHLAATPTSGGAAWPEPLGAIPTVIDPAALADISAATVADVAAALTAE